MIKLAGNVVCMEEVLNQYKVLVGKLERKNELENFSKMGVSCEN
jgi:hypothetical protein